MSESGWSDTEIFTWYRQEHLVKYFPACDAKSPVLVMYDGHKSHISIGLTEWAKQNHIILFVLSPHCSHLVLWALWDSTECSMPLILEGNWRE